MTYRMIKGSDANKGNHALVARHFWVVVDVLVHGITGLLVTSPLVRRGGTVAQTLTMLCVVFLAATLLDLAHFIAAGSLRLTGAVNLPSRPQTYSLTFALVMGALVLVISRSPGLALVTGIVLASHVVRDASGGTAPLWWPVRGGCQATSGEHAV